MSSPSIIPVHPTIAAYIRASNNYESDALIACFFSDAVVTDEGRTYSGIEQIRRWFAESTVAASVLLEPTAVSDQEGETTVVCRVSGTFPGSPIDLRFFFAVQNDRIATLTIR